MAVQSALWMKDGNKFTGIFCHLDGDENGELLTEYYSEPQKIARLIALGHISVLGKDLDYPHTRAYHRDYGEEFRDFQAESLEEVIEKVQEMGVLAIYLFDSDEGVWYRNRGLPFTVFEPVTKSMA